MMKSYSDRLHEAIPGGAHTYSRGDDQYPINAPQIMKGGKGAYSWTPEGDKFLDYGMALRAVTLGYADEEVDAAAIEQIKLGNNMTRASLIELETAEKMVDLIPCADMIKFGKNGSTVTSAAVKLARAYTGKKYIARCSQHPFFSYDDWFIGTTPITKGIPEEIRSLTLQFNYNDIASLEKLFTEYPNQIAGVILEPASSEEPVNEFLHKVKEQCHKNGAVFILDEMITGFRWDLRGAHHKYGIEPDLLTFGKGMANGYSVAALMGKKEIMNLGGIKEPGQDRVFLISTTHGAEMCGLGALNKVIDIYKRDNVTDHLWDYGNKLMTGANEISKELGLLDQFTFTGVACSPNYITKDRNGDISLPLRTLFSQEMINNKVLMPWVALTYSHGEKELEITFEAIRNSLKVYAKALDEGVEKYLKGDAIKPVFRPKN